MHIASFVEKDASFAVIVYVHSGNYLFFYEQETLASWFPTHKLPLLVERVSCLRELGRVLIEGEHHPQYRK